MTKASGNATMSLKLNSPLVYEMAAIFSRLCTKLNISLHLSPFKKLVVLPLVNKYTLQLHFIKAVGSFLCTEQHWCISSLPSACHMPQLSHNLFVRIKIRWAVWHVKLLILRVSSSVVYLYFLGPNVFHGTLLLSTHSQFTAAFLSVRD
jgi:hypothetical protein